MFGKRKKEAQGAEQVERRLRSEGLGDVWAALTGQNPAAIMPQIVATAVEAGGTRPAWQWQSQGQDYVLMAWPREQPIRAAVIVGGPAGGKLKPVTAVPLLDGLPNDLTVDEVQPRQEGMGADVGVSMLVEKRPMWFFDPLYGRDKDDLTPGVTHTFLLAGAAFGLRRALLDFVTITRGPRFEAYAQSWLAENPDKTRLDVPPLRIEVKNRHIIMPGRNFGEYEIRAVIEDAEELRFDKMPVWLLYLAFPFDDRPPLRLPLYVSKAVLGDYMPEKRHEIEAYVWLEGRIIDIEAGPGEPA